MMLFTGQPVWQNGMPQSMQRAPWRPISSSGRGRMNSLKNFTRSGAGTYGRSARSISMNPVIFPMSPFVLTRLDAALVVGAHFGLRRLPAARVLRGHLRQRAAILERHHLHELRQVGNPVLEHHTRAVAAGIEQVALYEGLQHRVVAAADVVELHLAVRLELAIGAALGRRVVFLGNRLELDHRHVAALREVALFVEHVGDAAGHSRGEVASRLAEDHDGSAGHVLAAVIAHALDDGGGAGIAHAEALAGHAAEVRFAADRAVHYPIADDDVLLRNNGRVLRGMDDDPPPGQALADGVVGISLQFEGEAVGEPRPEALSRRAFEFGEDSVLGQPRVAVAPRDLAREHRSDRAIAVEDARGDLDRPLRCEGGCGLGDQFVVESLGEAVVLRLALMHRDTFVDARLVEEPGEVEAFRFPVLDCRAHVEELGMPDHVLEAAHAEPGHPLAHFLGHEEEVVDDVLGLALEFLDELRILGGDPDRAGVEMALAHHDAALGYEGRRGEAEFVCAEQGADDDVAPGLHLTIGLHGDSAAQLVQDQRLLRFRKPDLPRAARILDRRQRRGAGAAIVPGNGDVVRLRLGHARGDRAHADFAHQLHGNARSGIHILQVVDELRKVLDRIDIVVGGRRDEAYARNGVANARDVLRDLVAGKLAALARLGALRHLDLQVVRIHQVLGRDAEAARGDLLDRRAHGIAVGERLVADGILAALAGVGFTADAIHRDRHRRVRLVRDRAERHGARGEALDQRLGAFDLVERHRSVRLPDAEEAAQREQLLALFVDELRILLVGRVRARTHGVLQLGDRVGRPHVRFAAYSIGAFAAGVEVVAI